MIKKTKLALMMITATALTNSGCHHETTEIRQAAEPVLQPMLANLHQLTNKKTYPHNTNKDEHRVYTHAILALEKNNPEFMEKYATELDTSHNNLLIRKRNTTSLLKVRMNYNKPPTASLKALVPAR